MIGDGKCPGCNKTVHVLNGPDSYVYDRDSYQFWHKQCYDEYDEFVMYYMQFHGLSGCELLQAVTLQSEMEG